MARHRQPLTKLLLALLVATGKEVIDLMSVMNDLNYYRSALLRGGHPHVSELKRLRREQDIRRAFYRLQDAHYVTARKIGKRLLVSLTDKGSANSLALQLRQAPVLAEERFTVVIFDVPQTQQAARRRLRQLLRQGEFKKLQQSVGVSKRDTLSLITRFVREKKLQSWVNVFLASDFLYPPHS